MDGIYGFAAVGIGSAPGCQALGLEPNAIVPYLRRGTLAANLIGGALTGIAVMAFKLFHVFG